MRLFIAFFHSISMEIPCMCVYVCMYVRMHVCMYVCLVCMYVFCSEIPCSSVCMYVFDICIHVCNVYVLVNPFLCVYACMYVCMCIYITKCTLNIESVRKNNVPPYVYKYIYTHTYNTGVCGKEGKQKVYMCMHVYMCVCMYVCMYFCMCVCVYIYIYI